MRRITVLAIVIIGLVALAAAIIPSLVSADLFKQRLADHIADLTGRSVVLTGDPMLSVYPRLTLSVGDVTIANPEGMGEEPFVAATTATARLRFTPLLIGRIEFDELDLVEPRIHLTVDHDGANNWQLAAWRMQPADADDGGALPDRLGRLRVTDGTIIYDNLATGRHEEMTGLGLEVIWPDATAAMSGAGTMQWRGETVEFNGSIAEPQKLSQGDRSPVRFGFAATPLRISFNGTLISLDRYQLVGDGVVTTPSMRRTIEWLAVPTGTGSILGAAAIAGHIDWFGSRISFSEAELELDGNVAEGAVSVDFAGERPNVQGTLAFDSLDLSPYIEAMRANLTAEGPWLIAPTSLPIADRLDADMRISTGAILIGSLRIGRAAIAGTIKDGKVTVDIGEAQFYGGSLAARMTAAMNGETLSCGAQVKASEVTMDAALSDLAAIAALDGLGTAAINLKSDGRNWGEFARAIAGTVTFKVADGSVSGIDMQALAALAPEVWPEPVLAGSGATRFTNLTGTLTIAAGGMETDNLVAEGDGFRVAVAGWTSIAGGRIDASATVATVGGGDGQREIPLVVDGTWREPKFLFDRDRVGPADGVEPDTPGPAGPRG